MKFEFECQVRETKGAINTFEKVGAFLQTATVVYTTNKNGLPAIYLDIPDSPKLRHLASVQTDGSDYMYRSMDFDGEVWDLTHACGNPDYKDALFPHCTNAAAEMIDAFIEKHVWQYKQRMDEDMK